VDLTSHWKKALPYYLQVSARFSLVYWVASLTAVIVGTLLSALFNRRLGISRVGFEIAAIIGGFFFLLSFLTAVGADVCRNRGALEGTIEWDPALVWKSFLYFGAIFFLVAAFLAFRQGVWLSLTFLCFSAGSAITAKVCL